MKGLIVALLVGLASTAYAEGGFKHDPPKPPNALVWVSYQAGVLYEDFGQNIDKYKSFFANFSRITPTMGRNHITSDLMGRHRDYRESLWSKCDLTGPCVDFYSCFIPKELNKQILTMMYGLKKAGDWIYENTIMEKAKDLMEKVVAIPHDATGPDDLLALHSIAHLGEICAKETKGIQLVERSLGRREWDLTFSQMYFKNIENKKEFGETGRSLMMWENQCNVIKDCVAEHVDEVNRAHGWELGAVR